jgi:hypothetical protein
LESIKTADSINPISNFLYSVLIPSALHLIGYMKEESRFDSGQRATYIYLLFNVQTVIGAHPTSYIIYTMGAFPRGKTAGG